MDTTLGMTQATLTAFRAVVERSTARGLDAASLAREARSLVREVARGSVPQAVAKLLRPLATLARMAESPAAQLDGAARAHVLGALAYVADPDDLIPDVLPEVGRLDDAIVVASIAAVLEDEIAAFQARERRAMYGRMQRRRDQRARRGGLFVTR